MSEPPDDFTPTHPGFIEQPPPPRAITPSGARRVPPSETKPRVSARTEAKLAPADARSAEGYDALELAGERAQAFAQAVTGGEVHAELIIDDSMVVKLTKLVPG